MVAGSSPARGASVFKDLLPKPDQMKQQIELRGQRLGQHFNKLADSDFDRAQ
jgi:hypothetical protein